MSAVRNPLFALADRTVNPFMAAVVKSPLERFVRPRTVLLTYTGRKTGKQYTIPVWAKVDGDTLRIAVGAPGQKRWWRNLRGEGAAVSLLLGRQERTGHAVASGDVDSGVRIIVTLDPLTS